MDLDDDVLQAAKALAARQRKPLGEVISSLLRRAVEPQRQELAERNGLPLFPISQGARPVTPDAVRELLDETP